MGTRGFVHIGAFVLVSWLGSAGCESTPGAPSDGGADVPGDVIADRGDDAPADGGPIAAFAGDWTVNPWTVTRAIGSTFPTFLDAGGVDSPGCARVTGDNYRATRIVISASDGSVRINDKPCTTTVSGSTLTASCGCANSIHVICSTVVTMRLEGSPPTLRGAEQIISNTPAGGGSEHPYCTVEATFEATRR